MEVFDSLSTFLYDWRVGFLIVSILLGTIILTRLSRWLIDKIISEENESLKLDPTRYKFFKNAVSFVLWILAIGAIISLIPRLKTLAITIFAGAGILVAILGFAAQQAFSNIVSGIFIIMFRPFRVGDFIKVGAVSTGVVEDITLRHTVIASLENKRIIIPNSVMSAETIVNDSIIDSRVCKWIEVGISYDSDVDLAIKILQEIAIAHPLSIDTRSMEEKEKGLPQIVVRFSNFGESSLNLRALVWCNDVYESFLMNSDINKEIKRRFEEEGVEIPFPYRTLVYKKDLSPNAKSSKDAD